jgi:tetratricopeptide (TPR) repeat protein
VKELRQAKEAEKAARASEDEKKAILNFLKNTLLSAGRPGGASLSEAFWTAGQAKDVSLRKALDATASQVAEAFADRPLAEAATREMLGLAYLNVGEPATAVQQYERAMALREAIQGLNDPEAAACRNQLAVAYRLAGRPTEAARLFDRNPNSAAHATALAVRGAMLLLEKKPAEAELKLRDCLTIRRKIQPDDWTTFDTESMLGEALLDQKKYVEAEPPLLSGYDGLKQHGAAIPLQDKPRLTRALERLVRLYEAWGKKDSATKWREMLPATAQPPKS